MKRVDLHRYDAHLKALLALVYGIGIPLLFWSYTKSSLALGLLLAVIVPLSLLQAGRSLAKGPLRWALSTVALLVTAAFGLALLIGIVITPFSAYKLWFEAMADGTGTGTVSNLFTLMSAFFSTALAATFISLGYVWPVLLSAAFVSAIVAVILQTGSWYLIALLAALACVLFLLLRDGAVYLNSATSYNKAAYNQAVRDDELAISFQGGYVRETGPTRFYDRDHPPPQSILERGVGFRPIHDSPQLAADQYATMTIQMATDYWMFCMADVLDQRLFADFEADSCLIIRRRPFIQRLLRAATFQLPNVDRYVGEVHYVDPLVARLAVIFQ